MFNACKTFADICRKNAQDFGEETAYLFSNSQAVTGTLSFAQLDAEATRIAGALYARCQPGDRVLLAFESAQEFVQAFFGCIYAGVVAVPLSRPTGERHSRKIRAIAVDAGSGLILTDHAWGLDAEDGLSGIELLGLDQLLARYGDVLPSGLAVADSAPVFLQYTSGSTGNPKGVVVTHRSLLANERMICDACRHDRETVFVGWLPLFHDMGLVGNVLQPAFLGIKSVLMPPAAFVRRPLRWLTLISEHRGTTSGGPNFGYEMCVRRIRDADIDALDLRSWRIAFNGAEPIRAETLRAFARRFARAGFSERAFFPVYGLAEATLLVTAPKLDVAPRVLELPQEPADADQARRRDDPASAARLELVGCGTPRGDEVLRIVDPKSGRVLADKQVGEIWVRGSNIAAGYWANPDLTRQVFQARTHDGDGPFLRTGDLGFVDGGELFVSGRLKDVIIINGRNHYPSDIESTVSACASQFAGRPCAAFSADPTRGEGLAVAQEVAKTLFLRSEGPAGLQRDLKQCVRDAVLAQHGVAPAHVLLVPQGSLPMTTSGKLQRSLCRELFSRGELQELTSVGETTLAP